MNDSHPNFFRRWMDGYLDRLTEKRSREYVKTYATHADGSCDEPLAYRINREVHRRSAMSRELDMYEPIRWAGISYAITAALGVAIKLATDPKVSKPALWTLAGTTALYSSIQLVRLVPRFDAALKGGVDTALAMHAFDLAHHGADVPMAHDPSSSWVARIDDVGLAGGWCRK